MLMRSEEPPQADEIAQILAQLAADADAAGVALLGFRSELDTLLVVGSHPTGLAGRRLQVLNAFTDLAGQGVRDSTDLTLPTTLTRWLGIRPRQVMLHGLRLPRFVGFLLFCWQGNAPDQVMAGSVVAASADALAAGIARHLADLDRRRLVDQFNAIMNNVGLGIAFTDATGHSTINHVAAELLGIPVGEGRAADLAAAMRERREHCHIRASHGLDDSELTNELEPTGPVSGEYWIFPHQPDRPTRVVRLETYDIGDSLNPGRAWVFNDVSALWEAAQRMKVVNAELQQNNIQLAAEIDKRSVVEAALRESEAEIRRYAEDLELTRASIEQRAHEAVELAEELALQKQELEESKRQSDYLANHDPLTGLFNRRAFRQHLQQMMDVAQGARTQAAILFIDLDKFKAVNDSLGHDAGDQLLKKVAQVLTETLRDTDLIARFGGDEFAIATRIPPHGGLERITGLAERIRQKLQIPMLAADGIIEVCGTIGIATFPADAADMDSLFIAADQAMYAGKKRGRNCVVMFKDLDDSAKQAH